MQDRDGWQLTPDGVQQALEQLMPRSAGAVVREAFYGAERFEEFLRRTRLPRSVLAQQLERLVSERVLEKLPYRVEGERTREGYRLTARGRGLGTALVAMLDWSRSWAEAGVEPTVLPVHVGCGAVVHAALHCSAGHSHVPVSDLEAAVGPGAVPLDRA